MAYHRDILKQEYYVKIHYKTVEDEMRKIIFTLIMLLITTTLFAGPFGLEMGWSYDEVVSNGVKILEDWGNGSYLIMPTLPHSSFVAYTIAIDEEYGVYQIIGMNDDIETSSNGTQFKSEFNKVKNQLISAYGDPTTDIDRLNYGSIWDEPQDYMLSLRYKDRLLACIWDPSEATENMKISLLAIGNSSTSGALGLIYASEYEDIVEARQEEAEASVL